jgi:hypothetical protein
MKFLPVISIIFCIIISCGNRNILYESKSFSNYPSASGIEYFDKKFYIIGDDANNFLITDSTLAVTDSISLYSFTEKRIPKAVKADLEAITTVLDNDQQKLLLLGSGSLPPYRNTAWLIDPVTQHTDSIRLDTFYQRLKFHGLDEINIEGVCSMPGMVILSNRGNKNYPKNFLIFTKQQFWKNQSQTPITLIRIGVNADSSVFNGVSGMDYASKSDRLILTVSIEDTRNSMDDGAIGKSYLWIINDISSKRNWKAINPNTIIDLETIDQRFTGQKIESVCVTEETKKTLHLVLAADNDNGSSTLFKMQIDK